MLLKSYYETQYGLKKNPFPGRATYSEDTQGIYVPEMFGHQREEFLRKFILAPLENGQPLIGAVWSIVPGDPEARGFGKSTLMGEEAKLINCDLGRSTLVGLGVSEEDAQANPVLASYASFNAKAYGGIASIDAVAFHLARFILRGKDASGESVHQRLFELAAARLIAQGKASAVNERDALVASVREKVRSFAVPIDIRNLLEDYLFLLASPDTDELQRFLVDEVGTWHHDRNGLKYLQLLVIFTELAGIEHLTFFIDQVEDFTANANSGKILKNVKIIRDALLETEPFSSRASFVFQLHPIAWERLSVAWTHEDLRSLHPDDPLNASVVVVLKGLETFDSARLLADRCLNDASVALPTRQGGIYPFTDSALKQVWEATKPKPRNYLSVLYGLLDLGKNERQPQIDDSFVKPKLEKLVSSVREIDGESGPVMNYDRLA
ncbi:MAG: hypothetical protein AB1611_08265 [bacterium]